MTNVPAALRSALADEVPFSTLEVAAQSEARDGTVKTLFRTRDGHSVEAVLMRYRDGRNSLCLSSQSGCPLTCTFCATGAMRFGRNLTASEILDQALHFRRIQPVDHAVFMGMGEPMMNLDAVLGACDRLPDLGITNRRTAISTVGWVPGIERLDPRVFKVNLIPYNPPDAPYRGSSRAAVDAFRATLEAHGLRATVRLTRGRDIAAACGQLAAREATKGRPSPVST